MDIRNTGGSSAKGGQMRAEELTLAQIRHIYDTCMKADFPPEELKPFSVIERMWRQDSYRAYGFYEGAEGTADGAADSAGTLCAYAFLLCNEKERVLLLDYFAVCSRMRGAGYGSRALPLLWERCGRWGCMVIEVEDDGLASIGEEVRRTRRRRISFYAGLGCRMTSTRSRVWGVDYRIMLMPLADADAQRRVAEKVTALYGGMYSAEEMKKHFAITAG